MLPRKSSPAPARRSAVAAEVRVPSLGMAFGALAASISPESLFLSTFQDLVVGTAVVIELALPGGAAVVDGVVVSADDPAGMGIAVELEPVDDILRERLVAASSSITPPAARVA